jgi:hypothetical protein
LNSLMTVLNANHAITAITTMRSPVVSTSSTSPDYNRTGAQPQRAMRSTVSGEIPDSA